MRLSDALSAKVRAVLTIFIFFYGSVVFVHCKLAVRSLDLYGSLINFFAVLSVFLYLFGSITGLMILRTKLLINKTGCYHKMRNLSN